MLTWKIPQASPWIGAIFQHFCSILALVLNVSGQKGSIEPLLLGTTLVVALVVVFQVIAFWGSRIRTVHDKSTVTAIFEQRLSEIRSKVVQKTALEFVRKASVPPSYQSLSNPLVEIDLNQPNIFQEQFGFDISETVNLNGTRFNFTYEVALERVSPATGNTLQNCSNGCRLNEIAVFHVRVQATQIGISHVGVNQTKDLYLSI